MTRLGVNVDHVATVRQARQAIEPDPVAAAIAAELAGAQGITVHIRGDRRHIQERDLDLLRRTVKTSLNVEMAATEEMMQMAGSIRPDYVTLVPERPEELTTEGGLNLIKQKRVMESAIERLSSEDMEVSLFVDPDIRQIETAAGLGARAVELNTAAYAEAVPAGLAEWREDFQRQLLQITECASQASAMGLRVLAGHGLTYRNVKPIAAIPEIEELNIGHNLISRAILVGMERAVREMMAAMKS
jgi:pyridoxine 5-phosphate synthase